MHSARSVVWLSDVDTASEHFGTHSKKLADLIQAKFPLVPGFVIAGHAYNKFLRENHLDHKIRQLLSTISFERPDSLMQAEHHIKQLFRQAIFSDELYDKIADFYFALGNEVILEMHETGIHGRKYAKKTVTSEAGIISEVINLWSEMFAGNALWHRYHRKIDHFDNGAEIIVRKKITGDKTGKIFTIDPITHAKDKLAIITEYPHERDEYILSKRNLTILDRNLKYLHHADKLTLDEIHAIAKLAKRVDEHLYFPQVISWILSNDALYVKTVLPVTSFAVPQTEKKKKLPIARGKGLTQAIGTGIVSVINTPTHLSNQTSHTILVVPDINPQHLKTLKHIKGLIIENHPHGETISLIRNQGIPAICNVKDATKCFRNGHIITVHGGTGEIYPGGMIN